MAGNQQWEVERPSQSSGTSSTRKPCVACRRRTTPSRPGAPVRLAKRTSNLFRPRDAAATAGLDVSGLDGVISVDPAARTADVQGMCTYEDLVDATLPHGLIPLVVPQLRTITLGGAVTGLGIESTSFRNGLPHESVLEMDVFTGARRGRHRAPRTTSTPTCSRPSPTPTARSATPPGCASSSSRCRSHVALRHVRFERHRGPAGRDRHDHRDRASGTASASTRSTATAFEPGEYYLTLARWTDAAAGDGLRLRRAADLLALDPAARDRPAHHLRLPVALGHRLVLVLARVRRPEPVVRRVWPRRFRRSDVYHRLVGLDRRFGDRRPARPPRRPARSASAWSRTSRCPSSGSGSSSTGSTSDVGMRPVWLCPLAAARARPPGRRTRSQPGRTYVNVGFWGAVPVGDDAPNSPLQPRHRGQGLRARRPQVALLRVVLRPRRPSTGSTTAPTSLRSSSATTPTHRLTSLYDKAVRRTMTQTQGPDLQHTAGPQAHPRRGVRDPARQAGPGPVHGVRRQRLRPRGRARSAST